MQRLPFLFSRRRLSGRILGAKIVIIRKSGVRDTMNLPEYAFSPIVLSCGEFNGFDVPTGENCDTYKIIRHHQLSIFVRNDNGLQLKGRMFTPKPEDIMFRRPGDTVEPIMPYHFYSVIVDVTGKYNGGDLTAHRARTARGGVGRFRICAHVFTRRRHNQTQGRTKRRRPFRQQSGMMRSPGGHAASPWPRPFRLALRTARV